MTKNSITYLEPSKPYHRVTHKGEIDPVTCTLEMKKDKYNSLYFDLALRAAKESVCGRRQVGCVIVTRDLGIGIGFNGTPEGWHTNGCELDDGTTNPITRHAEANALKKIMMNRMDPRGARVFIDTAPCIDCAKRLHDAEVSEVYFYDPYKCLEGVKFLINAGVSVHKVLKYDPEFESSKVFINDGKLFYGHKNGCSEVTPGQGTQHCAA